MCRAAAAGDGDGQFNGPALANDDLLYVLDNAAGGVSRHCEILQRILLQISGRTEHTSILYPW